MRGITRDILKQLKGSNWSAQKWQGLLSIYADQGDFKTDLWLPPVAGSYEATVNGIRFEPQFPLEPGLAYRAVFRPDQLPGGSGKGLPISSVFRLAALRGEATTVVRQIYPTSQMLPENLLKFYIHFSAPMSRGHIYGHIHLRDESAKDVELPFLEIDEELWDPTMTRLTLFMDPGRIKREVKPLMDVGPALEEGKRFTLVIDKGWKDGAGNPLKEDFQKAFSVRGPDRTPIEPASWRIKSAKAGSIDPVSIVFPEPLDHALAQRMIQVIDGSGQTVQGAVKLEDFEQRWSFIPDRPWRKGIYSIAAQTTLEDLAGNNIGKLFEVDLFEKVQRQFTNTTIKLAVEIR